MLRITLLFSIIAASAQADRLPDRLQSHRDRWGSVAKNACEGDAGAYLELTKAVENDHVGAASTSYGWLIASGTECHNHGQLRPKEDPEKASNPYYEYAANLGYPVAQSAYGIRLILGYGGIPKNIDAGVAHLQSAIKGGYGLAGVHLAEQMAKRSEPRYRDLIAQGLTAARRENVDDLRIYLAEARVLEAEWRKTKSIGTLESAILRYERVQEQYSSAKDKLAELRPIYFARKQPSNRVPTFDLMDDPELAKKVLDSMIENGFFD